MLDEDDFQIGAELSGRVLAVAYAYGVSSNSATIASGHATTSRAVLRGE